MTSDCATFWASCASGEPQLDNGSFGENFGKLSTFFRKAGFETLKFIFRWFYDFKKVWICETKRAWRSRWRNVVYANRAASWERQCLIVRSFWIPILCKHRFFCVNVGFFKPQFSRHFGPKNLCAAASRLVCLDGEFTRRAMVECNAPWEEPWLSPTPRGPWSVWGGSHLLGMHSLLLHAHSQLQKCRCQLHQLCRRKTRTPSP